MIKKLLNKVIVLGAILTIVWSIKSNLTSPVSAESLSSTLLSAPLIAESRFRYEPLLPKLDVQKFLSDRSSKLSTLKLSNSQTPAQVIEQISLKYEIAPEALLTLMQVQSGIIDTLKLTEDQINRPIDLPRGTAYGFKEQTEYAAKYLKEQDPKDYAMPDKKPTEDIILKDGKVVQIPSGKSGSNALKKLTAQSNDFSSIETKYNSKTSGFITTYQKYFAVSPLNQPAILTADLNNAKLPFTGTKRYTSGPHSSSSTTPCVQVPVADSSGIDFAKNQSIDNSNFNIQTIMPGTLLAIDYSPNGIGNRVKIQHSDSLVSEYWHLATTSAEIRAKNVGDSIPQGFPVGIAGDTGGQAAIHLHLDLRTPSWTPVEWNTQYLDGYEIGMHENVSDNTIGYNYQGSAVIGASDWKQLTASCNGAGYYNSLVNSNFTGTNEDNTIDPNTIFAVSNYDPGAGHLTSGNPWIQSYGSANSDTTSGVFPTADQGLIVFGNTYSASGWVFKLDRTGKMVWQKKYSNFIFTNAKATIANDGYVLVGGIGDVQVVKIDNDGNIIWQKSYGGTNTEYGYSVDVTGDGGYIVAGKTMSYGAGGYDAWLLRLDSSGNVIWNKTYGSTQSDLANSVVSSSDGGFIVAGLATTPYVASYSWIFKVNSVGVVQWQKTLKGSPSSPSGEISTVRQFPDGSIVAIGYLNSSGALIAKLDSSGNVLWQKSYGSAGIKPVIMTSDGGYLVSGNTSLYGSGLNDAWILKLDSSGNINWQKTYGGTSNESLLSITSTTDGEYVGVGYTSSYGAGSNDGWVIKLDSDGNTGYSCTLIHNSSVTPSPISGNVGTVSYSTTNPTPVVTNTSISVSNFSSTSAPQCNL